MTEINKIKRQKKKAAKQEKKFNEEREAKNAANTPSSKVEFDVEKEQADGWTLAGQKELVRLSRDDEDEEENYWQESDLDDDE